MAETRKIAAILAADVVGFSRMASTDEDGTLARLRALRSDLIDPTVALNNGRVFKRTGDGALIEFRSIVDAVRCAIAVQNSMVERFTGDPPDRRIVFRIGVHSATSSRRATATDGRLGSTSPPGWKASPRRARFAFPRTPIGRSRAGSISRSPISARPSLKKSPSRSGSIRCKSASPPRPSPPRSPRPRWRRPTSPRSRCCRSRT